MKTILTAVLVGLGVASIAASYATEGGFWFIGGLALIALGAVVSRFGGEADWWPGMTGKEF